MGLKQVLMITFVILLSGCTIIAKPMKNEQIEKIEKIGIVSFVGSDFSYAQLGFTVFGNSEKLVDQDYIDFDLEITRVLKETIEHKLDNQNPIEVVDLIFDKGQLIEKYKINDKYIKFDVKNASEIFFEIAKNNNVNYLLVVTRGYNAIDNGAGSMGGIGISRTAGMARGEVTLHNYIDYKVFDAETRTTPSFFTTAAMNVGQRRGVTFPWKEPLTEYSDSEMAELISLVIEDIEYRTPRAVYYMLKMRTDAK
ncbi:hypothetical protein [Alkalimonas mucilaginosa]|uniref:Lipoprotein n=1 Tax=Alkalimonas mucilaginosa TaxID=3057676 RepID=A0ABU7JD89_9GAMM|nr:hypothetical protein [Alkalimonas sp. MEB004]MEE2023125.1 hypothetical protein [Alkalimonas sp. MEB004]